MKKNQIPQAAALYVLLYCCNQDKTYPTPELHSQFEMFIQAQLNEMGLPNEPMFDEDGIPQIDWQLYGFPNDFNYQNMVMKTTADGMVSKPSIQSWIDAIQTRLTAKPGFVDDKKLLYLSINEISWS